MKTYMYDLYKHLKSRDDVDDVRAVCFACREEISEEDLEKHNKARLNRFLCNKCYGCLCNKC